jgi:hypothetical protein
MSRKKKRIAIVAGAAAAFAVAGGSAAIGADVLSPDEQNKAVIDDAAKQLGVKPSELSDALKDALKNRVDAAVAAGRLTDEQGDALKKRIDSSDAPFLFGGFGGRGFGFGGPGARGFGGPHFWGMHDLTSAASLLGITEAELRAELGDGKSLAEIAKANGKSLDELVKTLVADAQKRLADAVADGKLTQQQVDTIEKDLQARITEFVNREPGPWRDFRGDAPWPGPDHHFGQPDRMGHPA